MSAATATIRPARVLVIDDEPAVLRLVKLMLGRAKYDVTCCGSGPEGLRLMEKGEYDCVITDAIMPAMSGYDVVRAIRRHPTYADLPIVMLTRKRHRLDVKKAVEVGVNDYVLKPIDEHLLVDKVESALKKGSGKRHLHELSLAGHEADAALMFPCKITFISESDITLASPVPADSEHLPSMDTALFLQIGISPPMMKFLKSVKHTDEKENVWYELKFSFMGVPEDDLKRIRNWMQKQALKQRRAKA